MKKTLALAAASLLLATPVLADSQPTDTPTSGYNLNYKGITVNFGGFLEAASIYRTRNLNSDLSSPYQKLPLANSPGYYQDETRFSARQSRLSLLVKGDYNPATHLAGYYEMDFLGGAPTANSNESNSFNPRIRHLYSTIDWDDLGLHILGGQTWSLVTMNNRGITPRNEVTPIGIEAQYVPGFTWARQPQFRIVKDWDKTFWLGLSVENPQSVSSSTNNDVALGQTGGGNFSSVGTSFSNNSYPDFVVKASYDPSWGHFEIYDLIRVFKSSVVTNGIANNTQTATNAVGGGMILPVFTDKLKFQASAIYGKGIGRYGSGQLPDVTVDQNGYILPISELQLLTGVTYDPTSEWTFYGYYGLEQAQREDTGASDTKSGYGNALLNTSVGTIGNSKFAGQIQRIDQITAGTWWKFYQGKFGKMQAGVQYSYTENKYFSGTAGAPKVADSMIFTSLRYYWQ